MNGTAQEIRQRFFASLADPSTLLQLLDFVPGAFLYVKDLEGRFVALNRARVEMSRAKCADELLGKTDLDLHPAYWGERYRHEDRQVMESGRPLVNQVWLVPDAEGRLATFISSKIPLHDKAGHCIGIAGVMYRLNPKSDERPLEAATRLINERYVESLSVKDIAKSIGLSASQLNRRFKLLYHVSPSQYIQRVRVHEASRLLSTSDLAMSEIALRTGFYDQAHLTRTFRKWMQMSPKQFRKLTLKGNLHEDR
jgi:AraC-like DNA-binding protein